MERFVEACRAAARAWCRATACLQSLLPAGQSCADMNLVCITAVSMPAPFPQCVIKAQA
ncbi:MAG: hypothetical protein ACI4NA_07185 [Succinivibrio sp.]